MDSAKLVSTKQLEFCKGLLEKGKSRKEVVNALMEKFKLTRRTATTYVYLWFRGDSYKVVKKTEPEKKATKAAPKTTKKADPKPKTAKKPVKKETKSATKKTASAKASTDKTDNDDWEF
jgi:hypothetical protein